jgi:hypothetical protein
MLRRCPPVELSLSLVVKGPWSKNPIDRQEVYDLQSGIMSCARALALEKQNILSRRAFMLLHFFANMGAR